MIFYWINLDTDVTRKINIRHSFNEHNCLNVRVHAEQGRTTTEEKELACTRSHIKAISQFLQSTDPWAIICEDDLSFEFKPYWNADIEDIVRKAPPDWEIIQLAVTIHDDTIKRFQESTTNYLPHSAGFHSTVCYVINRTGAQRIVDAMPAGIADVVLYQVAKTYTYRRPLFTYTDSGSNIHPEHLEGHAQSKETVRNWVMSSKDLRTFNVVKVEIHASHACNFTCESCSHFSNNGHKGYISVEEADKYMGYWSQRLNPQWFTVLGGEPLLNPNIEDILTVARKHWKGEVEIITNGFLLPNFPNLGPLLQKLNISLVISKHGDTPEFNEKWNTVMRYLADKNMPYHARESFSNWTRRYKGWGPSVLPYEDNRPASSWDICPAKYCLQIFEGKLYKCPVIAYLKLQKKRWPEISPKWDRYLAYKPLDHTASNDELYDFINAKHEYICEMCPADRDQFNKPSPLITVGELLSKLNQTPQPL